MSTILLPVGHFLGPVHTPSAQEPESMDVRCVRGILSLTVGEYGVWALAHGDPDFVHLEPQTRPMLMALATRAGVPEPAEVINALLADGLLVELETRGAPAERFALRHNVFPLMLGLGNSPTEPDAFQIGLPDIPRATVSQSVYHLWMFAHLHPTLWEACEAAAKEWCAAAPTGATVQPADLLGTFLNALPTLLSTSCAYLDRIG